jgi:hypothetical protein
MHNPMPGAPYRVTAGDRAWPEKTDPPGTADGDAWIEIHCQGLPDECLLEWGDGAAPGTLLYSQTLHLVFPHDDDQEALRRRLHNLGYFSASDLDANASMFRTDYQMDASAEIASLLTGWHDEPDQVKPRPKPADPPDPGNNP